MAKKKPNILIIVLIVLAVLFLGRNLLIKSLVQTGFKAVTGLPLEIGSFKTGLFSTNIHIEDFKIKNPKGFDEEIMMEIPEVFVDYRLGSIITGKVHIEEFRFHLSEFNVVKKADGTSNLDSLTALQEAQGDDKKEKKDKPKADKPAKKKEIQIDSLSLKIDQAQAITHREGKDPSVKTFKIGIDENHKDIKSLNSVILMIVLKIALKAPAIATAGNIDVGILGDVMGGTLGKATEIIGSGAGVATDALDGAKGALSDTTGKLKGIFGGGE